MSGTHGAVHGVVNRAASQLMDHASLREWLLIDRRGGLLRYTPPLHAQTPLHAHVDVLVSGDEGDLTVSGRMGLDAVPVDDVLAKLPAEATNPAQQLSPLPVDLAGQYARRRTRVAVGSVPRRSVRTVRRGGEAGATRRQP